MTLLPCILDKTDIFLEHLDRYASSGQEFPLNKFTINLTFDIIGAITMNVDFDAQHAESSDQGVFIRLYDQLLTLYTAEGSQLPWWMYPRREWRRYRLGNQVDRHLEAMIRAKHAEQQQQQQQAGKAKPRDILSLSLQGSEQLTPSLLVETRDQIKTFLFAGHDTTGILLAWLFYELSRSPRVLKAVRDELDELFGPDSDPAAVREKLLGPNGEELIHRMSYTTAVIKETLRLYPPAGTARMSPPGTGLTVRTPDGQSFCLDGTIIYNCATIIQRDRAVFGDTANDFVPERWLGDKSGIMSAGSQDDAEQRGDAGDRKFPPGAWRPFERGPRNCIGQDLATIEARVIVAAVARRYDFVKVGLGELDLDEKGQPVLNEKGQYKTKSEMYNVSGSGGEASRVETGPMLTVCQDGAGDGQAGRCDEDEGETASVRCCRLCEKSKALGMMPSEVMGEAADRLHGLLGCNQGLGMRSVGNRGSRVSAWSAVHRRVTLRHRPSNSCWDKPRRICVWPSAGTLNLISAPSGPDSRNQKMSQVRFGPGPKKLLRGN
jgi:cytochrome P450